MQQWREVTFRKYYITPTYVMFLEDCIRVHYHAKATSS